MPQRSKVVVHLIVVSLTTENNRIIHIRKAVAFSDFTFLLQTFCNLLYLVLMGVQSRFGPTCD